MKEKKVSFIELIETRDINRFCELLLELSRSRGIGYTTILKIIEQRAKNKQGGRNEK